MAGQIKGITIEFDANVTRLTQTLNKVKAESKGVDQALREVNRQLRFDPKNTELLKQKQTLLKQKIDQTKDSLQKFKTMQNQADANKVDKQSAAYMKLRREIMEAQRKLKLYNAELARTKWQGMQQLGSSITSVGRKLTRATRYARMFAAALIGVSLYKGFERLKTLDEVNKQLEVLGYRGEKLDSIMEDVSGSVNGTRFMLQDMAKVASGALGSGVTDSYKLADYLGRTADLAQLAGIDVQSMGAMMNKAYSKGRVDAKIMNQLNAHGIPIYKLMQKELGVSADKLQEMSKAGQLTFDDLYRATDRYQGLAQKMGTETLPGAMTVLTQQFALIGADFLSGVYEPLKDGTKGIVQAIKDMRKDGTFKQWGQDLGDTVKYFVELLDKGTASMDGMSDGAKNLATVLTPLITAVGGLVKILAQLPPGVQGFLLFATLFGGPVLTAVGNGITMFANLGTQITTMTLNAKAGVGALSGLGSQTGTLASAVNLLLNPVGLVTLAIGAWALGMKKAYDEEHKFTQGFEDFQQASEEKMASIEAEANQVDYYKKKLDELSGKEHKSAADKAKIKEYVNQLNGAIDGLNLKYDEEKDKLNKTSDAIQKKIDKYKEEAKVKGYQDLITEAAKKQAEQQMELNKLYEQRDEIEKKWQDTADKSIMAEEGHNMALGDVNRKIADAETAMKQYDDEMNKAADQVAKLSGTTKKEMKKTTDSAKKEGAATPREYGAGIRKGKSGARAEARRLASACKNELGVSTYATGVNFAEGYRQGILSKCDDLAKAGAKLAADAINAVKKKQKDGSPSKVMRQHGRMFGLGYQLGIQDEAVPVMRTAANMVGGAISAATVPASGMALTAAGSSIETGGAFTQNNVFNIYGADDDEGLADKIATKVNELSRSVRFNG